MLKTVSDHCPGAGPSRSTYLASRLEREFEDYIPRIVSVDLAVHAAPSGGDTKHRVVVKIDHVDGRALSAEATRLRLSDALADAFEAAKYRLDPMFGRRVRDGEPADEATTR